MAGFGLGFASEGTVNEISAARKEPQWILTNRLKALEAFNRLPIEDHRLFTKYTDMSRANVGDCELSVVPSEPMQVTGGDMAGIAGVFHQVDAVSHSIRLTPALMEKGVIVETLQDAASRHPQLLRDIAFNQTTLPERDKFAQMSKAMWTGGLFLHVPDSTAIEHPIMIRLSSGREKSAFLSRTIISLGRNSTATVIEEIEPGAFAGNGGTSLFGATAEAVVGDGSALRYNCIENPGDGTAAFLNRQATLGDGSEVRWSLGFVGGEMVRSRVDNMLRGRGSKVTEVQVLYGDKSQFFDIFSHTRHFAEDTVSDLLSKAVLQAQSKAYAKGLITIDRGGKGADSYLGEFGMVLSRDARFLSIPSLEIENHAVKRAKHASSVAQIDENQVFYLNSRGIDESEARKLIVMGFLEPVVARIPVESVAARLRGLFEAKWAG